MLVYASGPVCASARSEWAWESERALAGAGITRRVRLHDLRGSAVALWLGAGLPLVYAQRQLGHQDIGVTVKHYGHLERGYLRDAAARAEASLWT